jgi:hypothetical protein
MKIEIGKTYICRDGSQFHAQELTRGYGRTYKVQGVDEHGCVTWRSIHGRFTSVPHRLDVVREATRQNSDTPENSEIRPTGRPTQ